MPKWSQYIDQMIPSCLFTRYSTSAWGPMALQVQKLKCTSNQEFYIPYTKLTISSPIEHW